MFKIVFSTLMISVCLFLNSCSKAAPEFDFSSGQWVKSTRCDGRKESWSTCYKNAKDACPQGYTITKQDNYYLNLGHGIVGFLAVEAVNQMANGQNGNRRLQFICKK